MVSGLSGWLWTMTSSSPLPTASRVSPGTPAVAGSRFFAKSSTPSNILSPTFPGQISSGDPVRASVAHLLVRAYTLPCSTAAQAFSQLVQPTARFQLALDALLPLLNSSIEVSMLLFAAIVHFIFIHCATPFHICSSPTAFSFHSSCIQCTLLIQFPSIPSSLLCMLPS